MLRRLGTAAAAVLLCTGLTASWAGDCCAARCKSSRAAACKCSDKCKGPKDCSCPGCCSRTADGCSDCPPGTGCCPCCKSGGKKVVVMPVPPCPIPAPPVTYVPCPPHIAPPVPPQCPCVTVPVMPPMPGYYGEPVYPPCPPPWAPEAMPAPNYHQAPRQYVVQVKAREGEADGTDEEAVKMAVREDCPCGVRTGPPSEQTRGSIRVRVTREGTRWVRLNLAARETNVEKCGKQGKIVRGITLRATRVVKLGQVTRFVLDKDGDGNPHHWLEVKVTKSSPPVRTAGVAACPAPQCPEPPPPPPTGECLAYPGCCAGTACPEYCPRVAKRREIDRFWNTVAGMVCDCFGCTSGPSGPAGMTLPSAGYVNHPPQYYPPSPAFPLPRELASMQATTARAGTPVMPEPLPIAACPPPPQVVPCVTTAAEKPAAEMKIAVVQHANEQRLEIVRGEDHMICSETTLRIKDGPKVRLGVAGGQVAIIMPGYRATADHVIFGSQHVLRMDGHVRVEQSTPYQHTQLIADCVRINMTDGSMQADGNSK